MKTITSLKREPLLFAAIVTRLKEMTREPKTAAEILAEFEPDPRQSIMGDAGYDHERRESGVLILAALDDLVNRKEAIVGTHPVSEHPTYQVRA